MKKLSVAAILVAIGTMACSAMPAHAAVQESPAPQAAVDTGTATRSWTNEQLVPLSMREAWRLSGKNEEVFFEMVKQLTELSAQKRGITLPDDKETGAKAGEWIKKQAKKDPDQLLYVIVDRAVQYSARMNAAK